MKFKRSSTPHGLTVELGAAESLLPLPPTNVFEMKTILVPTDFSPSAKKSLIYAAAFAEQFNARLILLHVVEPYPPIPDAPIVYLDDLQKFAMNGAERQLREVIQEAALRVPVEAKVQVGQHWSTITETAREHDVNLIIISTHGRTGLAHALLGSVAEKITRHAPCPVLVVRDKEKDFVVEAASPVS